MKIYLAGSFPRMTTSPLESDLAEMILSEYPAYRRLFSFFYEKEAMSAIAQLQDIHLIDKDFKPLVSELPG
jgi:hypothetical protein